MALDAVIPQSNRNIRKKAQLGATAHAKVNMVNKANVETMTILRPYVSLRGAKTTGPKT